MSYTDMYNSFPLPDTEDPLSMGFATSQASWISIPRTVDPSTIMTSAHDIFNSYGTTTYGSPTRSSSGSIRSYGSAPFDDFDSAPVSNTPNRRRDSTRKTDQPEQNASSRRSAARHRELMSTARANQFFCDLPGCQENGRRRSFTRNADLKRHIDSFHSPPRIDCYYPRCDRKGERGFSRTDHFNEHLRSFHHDQDALRTYQQNTDRGR